MPAVEAHGPSGGRNEPQPPGITPTGEPGSWERLDLLLEELPPGYPILPDEDRDDLSKYQNAGPRILSKDEAWQNCAQAIQKHDDELCKGYREEIDTLLAGLFSAVVTAFTVESYQWLQEDSDDTVVRLLSQIALSVAPNDSAPVVSSTPSGLPGSAAARINAYWFLALTLSLSAALVAILCKQWIREFERTAYFGVQYVSVRQVKFEGFQRYRVGEIVVALPLLLQLSLAIFALGVVDLLWHLHTAVAIIVGVPALFALAFYVITAVLPATQIIRYNILPRHELLDTAQYPYKSPQAWLIFRASVAVAEACMRSKASIGALFLSAISAFPESLHSENVDYPGEQSRHVLLRSHYDSWGDWDRSVHSYHCFSLYGTSSYTRALDWLAKSQNPGDIQNSIWNCHWDEVMLAARLERQSQQRFWWALTFTDISKPMEHRLKTLRMLFMGLFQCDQEFSIEMLVQNLKLMSPSQLADSLDWMLNGEKDAVPLSALIRAVATYTRNCFGEDIERIFLGLSKVLRTVHSPLLPTLRACVASMILNWICERETPHAAVTEKIRQACLELLLNISSGPDLDEYCYRRSAVAHIEVMAEMTRAFFEHYPGAPGLRVSWPPSPGLARHVSECAVVTGGDRMRRLLFRLLEISVCGVGHQVSIAAGHAKLSTETHAAVSPVHARSRSPSPRLSDAVEGRDLVHSDNMNTNTPTGSPETPLLNMTPEFNGGATHFPGSVTPLHCLEPRADPHWSHIPVDLAHPASPTKVIAGEPPASETGSDEISGAITVALPSGERQPFRRALSDAIPEGPGTSARSGDEGL